MSDNTDPNVWQLIIATGASFLAGLGLYQSKKVSDLSEKYVMKTDCGDYRSGMKDDFIRLEEKMNKRFDRIQDALERRQRSRDVCEED